MKTKKILFGILVGIVNSAFGAGGGLVSVPAMKSMGLNQKQAQASTLCVILPLSVISVIIYAVNGDFSFTEALKYIPFGIAGAIVGTVLMEKADNLLLKRIFALFMLWSGVRMILK